MGSYLNPGNKGFRETLDSSIYADKTAYLRDRESDEGIGNLRG